MRLEALRPRMGLRRPLRAGSRAAALLVAVTVSASACSGMAASQRGQQDEITVRVASYLDPKSSATVQALDWWADEVEKRSGGRVKFEKFYNASLFGATELRDAVGGGRVDVGHFAPGYHIADFPLTEGLHTVPGVAYSYAAHMEAVQELYESNDATRQEWRGQGLHLVRTVTAAEGALGTKKPIKTLDDLKGLDVRGFEGGGLNAGLKAFGANPVNLQFGELYEATQRGVVDGFIGLIIDAAAGLGLHETLKHWIDPGFGVAASTVIAANAEWWDSLPKDVRDIMDEVADEIVTQYPEFVAELESQACETIEKAGVKIAAFSDSDRERWLAAIADSQYAAWAGQAKGKVDDPRAYFDQYRSQVEQATADNPVDEAGLARCMK